MKRVWVAYALWLFGGVFGAHHVYLGRDRQAFLWFVSFGAGFCGFVSDFFHIPWMVEQANGSAECEKELQMKRRRHTRPPFSLIRVAGQLVTAVWWAETAVSSLPAAVAVMRPFAAAVAAALAVHTVGNIGLCRGRMVAPLAAAVVTSLVFATTTAAVSVRWTAAAATLAFELFSKQWSRRGHTVPQHSLCRRLLLLTLALCVFYSLYASYLYFNAEIEQSDGERVLFRHALRNFFHSPLWKQLKEELVRAWRVQLASGWRAAVAQLLDSWDPSGARHALRVLGVARNATRHQISSRYRQLSRQLHPDRFQEPELKAEAERRFTEINVAYDTLGRLRRAKNRQHSKDEL